MEQYIVINITQGAVNEIDPIDPQTESARMGPENQKRFLTLGGVLNKMAEYGYELVPGFTIPVNDVTTNIVMRRKS